MNNLVNLDLVPNARHEYTPTRRLSISYMFFSHNGNRQYLLMEKLRSADGRKFALSGNVGRYPSLEEAVTAMQELAVADRVAHALKGPP